MGPNMNRSLLAASLLAIGAGIGAGGAQVIPREYDSPILPKLPRLQRERVGRRSNEPRKLSAREQKKRIRKIARASRRHNLRHA